MYRQIRNGDSAEEVREKLNSALATVNEAIEIVQNVQSEIRTEVSEIKSVTERLDSRTLVVEQDAYDIMLSNGEIDEDKIYLIPEE